MPHIDLLELPYFEGISLDGLVSLVDLMQPAEFRAGEIIVEEHAESPETLFIATNGALRISKRDPQGDSCDLAELTAPTLFGEIEFFCGISAVCTATAISRVSAFKLTRKTFDELFQAKHPALLQFTFNVARVACHRLAIADEMQAEYLKGADLVALRQKVFARLAGPNRSSNTTGVFDRSELQLDKK